MLGFTFVLLLCAFSALAAPTNTTISERSCGNNPDASEIESMESTFSTDIVANGMNDSVLDTKKTIIPVYFHVIRDGDVPTRGNVPRARIDRQIRVLNDGFRSIRIGFDLKVVDRTINSHWFTLEGTDPSDEMDMKRRLRRGKSCALNIYSVGYAGGNLGWSSFPVQYGANPYNDGIVFLYTALAGGTLAPFNLGKSLVHQVGHWVGLYHTFEGLSCDGPGDLVDDTPTESTPTRGCPNTKSSCGHLDPIHNFMDYSDDKCLTEFTKGQGERAKAQLKIYRNC